MAASNKAVNALASAIAAMLVPALMASGVSAQTVAYGAKSEPRTRKSTKGKGGRKSTLTDAQRAERKAKSDAFVERAAGWAQRKERNRFLSAAFKALGSGYTPEEWKRSQELMIANVGKGQQFGEASENAVAAVLSARPQA